MHSIRFLCKNLKNSVAIEGIFAGRKGVESRVHRAMNRVRK